MNTEELKAEVERLNSELTEARELLTDLKYWAPSKGQVMIDRFLAHQSAPAAKRCTCGEPGSGKVVEGDLRPSFMDCPVHAPVAKAGSDE